MRKSLGSLSIGLAFAMALGAVLSACSQTGSSTSATSLARRDASNYDYSGEVYLLRGLANVFSTGLDQLNDKFRLRRVKSKVDNHTVWQAWANDIITRDKAGNVSYPIVIMGHSLGGNASVQMARYLGENGVKVSYVAAFDPTITTEPGPNVDEVVNYYLPNGKKGKDANIVVEGPGFQGSITNVDVTPIDGINHFNVEKNPQLQVRVMTKAMQLLKPRYTSGEPGQFR